MAAIFVLFSAMYTWVFFVDGHVFDGDPPWKRVPIEVGSFLLWGLVIFGAASAFYEEVTVSDVGVSRRSFRGIRSLPWSSLERIDIAKHGEGARLIGRNGLMLPISSDLDGLPMLVSYLERYASEANVFHARMALELPPRAGA